MSDKIIKLSIFNTVITLTEIDAERPELYIAGKISSELKQPCQHCKSRECNGFECKEYEEFTGAETAETIHDYHINSEKRTIFNLQMNVIESVILYHTIAGIDVQSPSYEEGIDASIDLAIKIFNSQN